MRTHPDGEQDFSYLQVSKLNSVLAHNSVDRPDRENQFAFVEEARSRSNVCSSCHPKEEGCEGFGMNSEDVY